MKAYILFDLMVMIAAFGLSCYLTYGGQTKISFEEFLSMRIKIQNFAIFLVFIFLWRLIFSFFELYRSRRLSHQRQEVYDVIKATTVGVLVLAIWAVILRLTMVTPSFLAVFWATSTGVTLTSRLLLRYALRRIRLHGRNLRHILIVGSNSRAVRYARGIESKPELGYRIIGFVDDPFSSNGEFKKSGYPLATDFAGFPNYLRNHTVDEVIITLPIKSFYDRASEIVAFCEEQGILIRYPSELFNLKIGESTAELIEDDPMVTVSMGSVKGTAVFAKRAFDISASLTLLIFLFPLLVLIGVLIKLTSPGPIFFVQDRVGLGKRRFKLHKFRTMVQDAEKLQAELENLNELGGPVFKIKNDPRITTIGKFLRRTSMDELPQLMNVLAGDMSLVGPRPLPIRDFEGFDEDWHRRRFSVRPGITCLWQVNGRSDIPFKKWMELDMNYIDRWSIWLDFEILLRTIPAVLRGSGAA